MGRLAHDTAARSLETTHTPKKWSWVPHGRGMSPGAAAAPRNRTPSPVFEGSAMAPMRREPSSSRRHAFGWSLGDYFLPSASLSRRRRESWDDQCCSGRCRSRGVGCVTSAAPHKNTQFAGKTNLRTPQGGVSDRGTPACFSVAAETMRDATTSRRSACVAAVELRQSGRLT
jgi:hypothetical protein